LEPKLKFAAKTDVGLVRSGNEDFLHLDEASNVYAVCDGMGGHQAGEVASMTASQTLERVFREFDDDILKADALEIEASVPTTGELLLKSIRLANRNIYNKALTDPKLNGMGTTIVAVAFEQDIMSIAHVGDSRAYRLEERKLVPLTRDHSWLVEMQDQQQISEADANSLIAKNVITRALGVKDTVEVDYRIIKVKPGDLFILCSDGLCGFADDDEIFAVADRARGNLQKMTEDLVQMANDRGGSDNVTVVAIEVEKVEASSLAELDVFTLGPEHSGTLEAEDQWVERLATVPEPSEEKKSAVSNEGGSKFLVIGIFLAFIVAAILIMYFTQAN
jgi:serine/threonine protein phosphatase PrpC